MFKNINVNPNKEIIKDAWGDFKLFWKREWDMLTRVFRGRR